jgi:L-glyceraldehyde 3-phosphate reductase
MLTNKYLHVIPADSRAAKPTGFLKADQITNDKLKQINALNDLAVKRGQTLAQMALSWLLKDKRVTSVLVGASSAGQLADSLKCLDNVEFSNEELVTINNILSN